MRHLVGYSDTIQVNNYASMKKYGKLHFQPYVMPELFDFLGDYLIRLIGSVYFSHVAEVIGLRWCASHVCLFR